MTSIWPWLALVGLGAFHGLNPAMGWLFAVALGIHRRSRRVLLVSLLPIALGHAIAIAIVVFSVMILGFAIGTGRLGVVCGLLLIVWGTYHALYGYRHRVSVGLQTGFVGLAIWSFLMATAHGAGLMLIPALLPLQHHLEHTHGSMPSGSIMISSLAVAVHTLSMLTVTGLISLVVYDGVGLAFLRRGWINLDMLWTAGLILAGCLLLFV
jgi:hypothetical protein